MKQIFAFLRTQKTKNEEFDFPSPSSLDAANRDPSPELVRISPLVTRPPKPKLPSKSKLLYSLLKLINFPRYKKKIQKTPKSLNSKVAVMNLPHVNPYKDQQYSNQQYQTPQSFNQLEIEEPTTFPSHYHVPHQQPATQFAQFEPQYQQQAFVPPPAEVWNISQNKASYVVSIEE